MNSIQLLGVRIDLIDRADLIEEIITRTRERRKSIIAYVNLHALNLAYGHAELRAFFNAAPLVYCDGFGARLGAWLAGQSLPERNTPPDWIDELCERCAFQKISVYLLGDTPEVAQKAARILSARHSGMKVVGWHHGFFTESEEDAVLQHISSAQPDILLLGMGMPKQELWLQKYWAKLEAAVALPVGALFTYVAGAQTRAPSFVTGHGLEWLARLLAEPRRLWRRYLIGIPLFFGRVLIARWAGAELQKSG